MTVWECEPCQAHFDDSGADLPEGYDNGAWLWSKGAMVHRCPGGLGAGRVAVPRSTPAPDPSVELTAAQVTLLLGKHDIERLSGAAVIEHEFGRGIAIMLGENLKSPDRFNTAGWLSTDVIVFWDNGDHTVLPDAGIRVLQMVF